MVGGAEASRAYDRNVMGKGKACCVSQLEGQRETVPHSRTQSESGNGTFQLGF
jgi:hypothetical protein